MMIVCLVYGGRLVMYKRFDTQPAQWERALKTAMLCSAVVLVSSGGSGMYGVVVVCMVSWFTMIWCWYGMEG